MSVGCCRKCRSSLRLKPLGRSDRAAVSAVLAYARTDFLSLMEAPNH